MKSGDQFHPPMRACLASVLLVGLIFLGVGFAVAQDSPQLMDHTICKGLNENNEPVGRTDTFSSQDAAVYSSIKIGPVYGSHEIDWNWYSPNRELYYSSTRTINPSLDYLDWDWASSWINIKGQKAARLPGEWRVEVLVDGHLVPTEKFNLISKSEDVSQNQVTQYQEKTAPDWMAEGNARFGQGNYDEAIAAYDNALQLNPQLAEAWYGKGVVLNKQSKFDDAITAYDNAIGLNPEFAYAWCNKGDSLQKKSSYEDAIKAYDKAIELDPTDAYPLNNKGVVLSKLGKYEDAIKAFDQALGIDPNNEEAQSNKRTAEAALAKKQPSTVEQPAIIEAPTTQPGQVTEILEPVITRHEPLSQTINPSDQPQTISYQDKVKVTLPGGMLKEPQTLTIAKVEGLPGKDIPFLKSGDQYEISLGDIHTFDENVTIDMAYDPASITEGVSPQDQLIVTSWNETRRMWERAEFEVDESKNTVIARTKHLSIWGAYYALWGLQPHYLYKQSSSGNCEIRFWINDADNPWIVGDDAAKYFGSDAKKWKVIKPSLLDVLMDYFNKSWDKYEDAGFHMPTGTFDVFIVQRKGGEALESPESAIFSIDNVIYFPAQLIESPELKQDVAHELFHSVQYQYMRTYSMIGGRRWWIEATADYAAAKVAWPQDDAVQKQTFKLKPYYLEGPLTYFSENKGDRFYRHQYQTSAFVDFLVSHVGADFKEMWEYTANPSWGDIADALDPLDKFLKSKKTSVVGIELTEGLREKYLQFAEFYLFDQNSPIPDSDTVPDEALNKKTELSSSKKKDVWEVKLDPDYTAKVWELSVSPEVGNSIILNVSFDSSSTNLPYIGIGTSGSGFEWVRIYKLEGFKRTSATEAYVTTIDAKDEKSAEVEMSPWDGLYVLAINPYGSWLNLKLNANLSIPTLEIQRPFSESEKGVPETEYRFSVIKSDIPDDAEYEWDFGDGETADGESVTHKFESEGDYAVGVQATWSGGSAENETDIEIEPPSVEIRRPFSEGQKGVPETDYTFSVIKKGIPDDAQYTWSFGDGGTASGEMATHKFAQEGDYTVRLSASWSDGSAENETAIGIEKKTCESLEIVWSAQTFESQIKWNWPGSQQTFTSGGPGLDKTFIEEWSYGDGSSDRQEYSLIGEDGEMKIIPKDNSDESTKDFGTRYHTYGDVGVYTVERRVTSSLGCAYGSIQIEIVDRPTLYGDNNGDNE
jgi:tetratricopeptide (TPR) repeat protein